MTTEQVSYKLKDLREQAKSLGLKGWSVANKARLIDMIESHPTVSAVKPAHPAVVAENKELDVVSETTPVTKPKRDVMLSTWHQFLNSYTKEHGCSRKQAMSAKDEYASFKAKLQTSA